MIKTFLLYLLELLGEDTADEVYTLQRQLAESHIQKKLGVKLYRQLLGEFQVLQLKYKQDISAYRYFLVIAVMLLGFVLIGA